LQVFISFASEQREATELVAVALRERGYNVFFSQDTLPATAAQVDKLLKQTRRRDVALIALAGAATGALSYLLFTYWRNVLLIPFVIPVGDFAGRGVSALPGLLFGALVGSPTGGAEFETRCISP
jgi:hypothetical protein